MFAEQWRRRLAIPVALLALCVTTSCMRYAPTRILAPETFVEWHERDGPRQWTSLGLTVELAAAEVEGGRHPVWTISAPGMRTARVRNLDSWTADAPRVAIGPLTRGGPPSVIMQSFTGGTHCCWKVVVATPVGREFQIVGVDEWDGDAIGWPRDLNGDGSVDFQNVDAAFQYAFGTYICCASPPQITDIRNGEAVDVSAEPGFAAIYRADMARWRDCVTQGGQPHCAVYAADAARLGELDKVWPGIVANFTRHEEFWDRNESHWACFDKLTPYCRPTYTETLRAFLRQRGYVR